MNLCAKTTCLTPIFETVHLYAPKPPVYHLYPIFETVQNHLSNTCLLSNLCGLWNLICVALETSSLWPSRPHLCVAASESPLRSKWTRKVCPFWTYLIQNGHTSQPACLPQTTFFRGVCSGRIRLCQNGKIEKKTCPKSCQSCPNFRENRPIEWIGPRGPF